MDLIGRRPLKPVRGFYAAPRPSFKASFTIGDCGRQFEESETEWPQSVQARYLADAYYATSGPKIRSPLALWERAKYCIYTPRTPVITSRCCSLLQAITRRAAGPRSLRCLSTRVGHPSSQWRAIRGTGCATPRHSHFGDLCLETYSVCSL